MVRALLHDFFHDALITDRGAPRQGDHELTRVELGAKAKFPPLSLFSDPSNIESQTAVQVPQAPTPPS